MVAVAEGDDLIFEHIEPRLLHFLGYSQLDQTPLSAYDFLPPSMAQPHRQWVRNSVRAGRLPERLSHPLRSVEIKHACGFYVEMDLNIEWITDSTELAFHLVFIPILRPPETLTQNAPAIQQVQFSQMPLQTI
jgi:hypothetical protein